LVTAVLVIFPGAIRSVPRRSSAGEGDMAASIEHLQQQGLEIRRNSSASDHQNGGRAV
jgi:hypothetical protein